MTDVSVQAYTPNDDDFQRVDDQLTAFSKSRGGVDYLTIRCAFKAVANDNGAQKGMTMGEIIACGNSWGQIEVERIFVAEAARGKGIGKILLDSVEKYARDINMAAIIVASPTWQQGRIDNTEGFYEKNGYTVQMKVPLNLDKQFGSKQYNVFYMKELEPTAPLITKDFA